MSCFARCVRYRTDEALTLAARPINLAPEAAPTRMLPIRGCQRLEPQRGRIVGREGAQPLVLPQIRRQLVELLGVYGAPLSLQPVRTDGNPDFAVHG